MIRELAEGFLTERELASFDELLDALLGDPDDVGEVVADLSWLIDRASRRRDAGRARRPATATPPARRSRVLDQRNMPLDVPGVPSDRGPYG